MGDEFGDVEADPAGAHDGDAPADLAPAHDDVDIADRLGVIDAVKLRLAGFDAGGHHAPVETASPEQRRIDAGVEMQRDAVHLDHPAEVPEGLGELLLAGDAFRKIELTADFAGCVVEGDPVPALRRLDGVGQTRWPRADDSNALRFGRDLFPQQRLVAGARIDEAAGDLPREGVVEAGLVAGDA
eukprot:gene25003-31073_t